MKLSVISILSLLLVGTAFVYLIIRLFDGTSGKNSSKSRAKIHHAELVRVLLQLDEKSLDELLGLYAEKFGAGAARYARQTHRKWKAGEVRPNRQTFERLLVDLPKVMSFDLKCELMRRLMEEYGAKKDYRLDVDTDDWETALAPLVEEIIERPYKTELPPGLERRLRWLADGEMRLAEDILKRSQVEESRIAVSMLRGEMENIEKMLAATRLRPKITHRLKFPYGTITLNIKRRKT
jgi:hypothetical protein